MIILKHVEYKIKDSSELERLLSRLIDKANALGRQKAGMFVALFFAAGDLWCQIAIKATQADSLAAMLGRWPYKWNAHELN